MICLLEVPKLLENLVIEIIVNLPSQGWVETHQKYLHFCLAFDVRLVIYFGHVPKNVLFYPVWKIMRVQAESYILLEFVASRINIFGFSYLCCYASDYVCLKECSKNKNQNAIHILCHVWRHDIIPNHQQYWIIHHSQILIYFSLHMIVGIFSRHVYLWYPVVIVPIHLFEELWFLVKAIYMQGFPMVMNDDEEETTYPMGYYYKSQH